MNPKETALETTTTKKTHLEQRIFLRVNNETTPLVALFLVPNEVVVKFNGVVLGRIAVYLSMARWSSPWYGTHIG